MRNPAAHGMTSVTTKMPGGFVPAREANMVSEWVGPKPNLRGSTRKRAAPKRNIVRIKRTVKQCMEQMLELKHSPTAVAINPLLAAGQFISPCLLVQGSSAVTRIGQQIKARSLSFHCLIQSPAAMASDVIRVIAFVDRQPNGALPNVLDIMTTSTPPSSYNMDKVDHLGHRFRFKVLLDKTYEVFNSAATVTTRQVPCFFELKLNHIIHYQSNAGTIADLLSNNIGILVTTNSGNCSLNGEAMLCYTDE